MQEGRLSQSLDGGRPWTSSTVERPWTAHSHRPSTAQAVMEKLHVQKVDRVEGGGLRILCCTLTKQCRLTLIVFSFLFILVGLLLTIISYRLQLKESEPNDDQENFFQRNLASMKVAGPGLLVFGVGMLVTGLFIMCLSWKVRKDTALKEEMLEGYSCPIHSEPGSSDGRSRAPSVLSMPPGSFNSNIYYPSRPVTRGTVASMDASMRKISIEEEDEAEVQGNASGNRGFSAGNRGFSADGESKADLSHQHSILVSPQAGGDGGRAGGICEACTGRPSTSYRYDMDRYRNSVDLGMSNRDIASFPPPLVTASPDVPKLSPPET